MPDPIKPTETYIWQASVLWNVKPVEVYTKCPEWDEDEHGERPCSRFGVYVQYCSSGSCAEDWDFKYELLPGFQEDPPCDAKNEFYKKLIHGYCTPEAAERAYVGKSISITHNGGSMKIRGCGGLGAGNIIMGVDFTPQEEGTDPEIGKPIEECMFPGIEYTLQGFGCDNENKCGTLGIGGNWGGNPDRPGWFYLEVKDPFELKCPGFAGHPDLYSDEDKSPNYALPVYKVDGNLTKYDIDGEIEYYLTEFTFTLKWDNSPPERPEWAKWPPRHTEEGAWTSKVKVKYYFQGGHTEEYDDWIMELVWNGREGVWMIMVYAVKGKPSKKGNIAPWADIFVNKNTIGPCRLGGAATDELRTFDPLRSKDPGVIDGQFVVQRAEPG